MYYKKKIKISVQIHKADKINSFVLDFDQNKNTFQLFTISSKSSLFIYKILSK